MRKIILLAFFMCMFTSTVFAQFDLSNANIQDLFYQQSNWQYLYSTDTEDFYIDRTNSYTFYKNDNAFSYITYILTIEKNPEAVLASVEKIMYLYNNDTKIYRARTLDFRNFNVSGVIFSPQSLFMKLPDTFKELTGNDKILAQKVLFPSN